MATTAVPKTKISGGAFLLEERQPNEVFTPDEEEIAWARRVLAASMDAARAGRGSFALDGQMIDAASLRMARATLARAGLSED